MRNYWAALNRKTFRTKCRLHTIDRSIGYPLTTTLSDRCFSSEIHKIWIRIIWNNSFGHYIICAFVIQTVHKVFSVVINLTSIVRCQLIFFSILHTIIIIYVCRSKNTYILHFAWYTFRIISILSQWRGPFITSRNSMCEQKQRPPIFICNNVELCFIIINVFRVKRKLLLQYYYILQRWITCVTCIYIRECTFITINGNSIEKWKKNARYI